MLGEIGYENLRLHFDFMVLWLPNPCVEDLSMYIWVVGWHISFKFTPKYLGEDETRFGEAYVFGTVGKTHR